MNPYFHGLEQYSTPQPPPQPEATSRGPRWYGKPMMTQDTTGGVGTIGAAVTSAIPNQYDGKFSADPNAGFKGSFKGLASGGVAGAIIGGVGAQIGEFGRINKELKNLDTSVDGMTYDGYGRPQYNGAAFADANNNLSELSEGEKSFGVIGDGHGGRGLDPATALFSWAMGTRKKLRRKRDQLTKGLETAQTNYNAAESQSRLQNNQMEDYYQRMNPANRMRNVYRQQS
jgi:hypothetical protein